MKIVKDHLLNVFSGGDASAKYSYVDESVESFFCPISREALDHIGEEVDTPISSVISDNVCDMVESAVRRMMYDFVKARKKKLVADKTIRLIEHQLSCALLASVSNAIDERVSAKIADAVFGDVANEVASTIETIADRVNEELPDYPS